ncbi:MAG: hypothetical protein J2P48_23930 [Alphaproteobacteria bacterium]|nr:hypothetical protein [Alphaproteobacteria bacterium]
MIDSWAWGLFQELLGTLQQIAWRSQCELANIGIRDVLDRPVVAGVVIGARLGIARHLADNAQVFGLPLDAVENAKVEGVFAKSRELMQLTGDCGDENR